MHGPPGSAAGGRGVRRCGQGRSADRGDDRHRRDPGQRGRARQPPRLHRAHHAVPHRPGGADLVWYGAAAGRAVTPRSTPSPCWKTTTGVLVRDDYGGYTKFDTTLAGVQQCCSHLFRHLADVHAIDPHQHAWTDQAARALRAAGNAVTAARAADPHATSLDPVLLARLRREYDHAVNVGISINLSRRWHKGNHPGLVLAQRLKRKTDQVWLFTTRFDVPWTNNASEQAIRGIKVHQKISGCWKTLAPLQRHCRIRSYLTTAHNHGISALTAIRDALTDNPWMPPQSA
ncbi:MAG: IS66 family transposase [Streptomycetales bacterium]